MAMDDLDRQEKRRRDLKLLNEMLNETLEPMRQRRKTIEDQIQSATMNLSLYSSDDTLLRPFSACNYRVPEKLRKGNEDAYTGSEDAYTPRVVSIGPIHHGTLHLQVMERYKWKLLGKYLNRNLCDLESIVAITIDIEDEARVSYGDSFNNIKRREFSEMIMLDFIFIIELLKLDFPSDPTTSVGNAQKELDDHWIKRDITHDMMLLENQLPLAIVTRLFDSLYKEANSANLLPNLILEYFKNNARSSFNAIKIPLDPTSTDIVDFLVKCHDNQMNSGTTVTHSTAIEMHPTTRTATELRQRTHSATQLHDEGGVKFSNLENAAYLLDIKFGDNGVLEIPAIKVDSLTETIFLNMMVSEQSRRKKSTRISGYIFLMSALIKSPKDVVLLEKCGIIENYLGNGEQVIRLFDNISKYVVVDNSGFYFVDLYERLHSYSKDYWHQWKGAWFNRKRMLKRNYFGSPWSIIFVIAAFILLVLTFIQAVCSIIQSKGGPT